MNAFRFHSPAWLLLLLALPLLAWWIGGRRRGAAALRYPSLALLGSAAAAVRNGPGAWLAALRWLALALLVVALARPQVEKADTREDSRGINIVLALDFSGTMRTRDFYLDGRRVARSEGLKRICGEFIQGRPNDRIGLVWFDRDAVVASPLTLDHTWLVEQLMQETNGSGTALGSALIVAADHLQRHTNETRVIVLLTDAENLSAGPPPDEVVPLLARLGVRVHIVQVLSPQQGTPMNDLSEYLTRAAARTGGGFFRVRSGAHLRSVYARIDQLEKQRLTDQRVRAWRELLGWVAIPALGVLLSELVLSQTRWRRVP